MSLSAGALFANRFEIDRVAGRGGMGTVYRAHDRLTGALVALKLLASPDHSRQGSERFAREAQLLSGLQHPGIVSHVAHGVTEDGLNFLAMEWLEGEDLAQRLLRGPLSLLEARVLLERIAAALTVAHQRGVIHRDLKPTNLFLVGAEVERVKVLDFGIARRLNASRAVTHTGLVIGTPEYMAPEQARGSRELTPAADIFSLGCVLYECLTGQPPFCGEHIAAVLVRILFEEPPPLHSRRPGVPEALTRLLQRMLNKDPAQRPADAAALWACLVAPGTLSQNELPPTLTAATAWLPSTAPEQHLFSVVFATPPRSSDGHDDSDSTVMTAATQAQLERRHSLVKTLASMGASAEWLLDGSLVVAVSAAGSAIDQVTHAARLALVVKERWPAAEVALATGRGEVQGAVPVGEVIDRATRLLGLRSVANADSRPSSGVWVDEVSAGLLEGRFALSTQNGHAFLSGEELSADETRPLLGKPTPCVGREQELAMIGALLASCIEESEPRVVLITAAAGVGKSRLRHELLRRVRTSYSTVTVLLGRGDMMSAGAPYGILGRALRHLSGIDDSAPPEVQRQLLGTRLGQYVAEAERAHVIAFLGELCGVPFPDENSVKLRAARQDPRIMRGQIAAAFLDWLAAESEQAPLLLVLEDLHWGDALTVNAIDSALREHKDRPFMVLGLARPEVHDLFPKLWQGRSLKELPLGGLSKKACERLIQQVLGKEVAGAVVARLSAQAEGNALYLEELIRAVGEGKGDELPETVLAMLQARIGRLDAGARQVLRAAGVFGATFWSGGVKALLPAERMATDVASALSHLLENELIESHPHSRFQGEAEYGFRHALMREAAYSLISNEARPLCHDLAAGYLEQRGEPDPMIIADHLHRAGRLQRAIPYYIRAAEQAFEGYDLPEAVARAAKGLACSPQGEARGALLGTQASAYLWSGQSEASYQAGIEAKSLLAAGSFLWWRNIASLLISTIALARPQSEFDDLADTLARVAPNADSLPAYSEAISHLVAMMSVIGQRAAADRFLHKLLQLSRGGEAIPGIVDMWTEYAISYNYVHLGRDPWRTLVHGKKGYLAAESISYRRIMGTLKCEQGFSELLIGEFTQGEENLRAGTKLLFDFNETTVYAYLLTFLVLHLAEHCNDNRLAEILSLSSYLIEQNGSAVANEGSAYCALASVYVYQGKLEEAAIAARRSITLLQHLPPTQMLGFAALVRVLLKQGRGAEAQEVAEDGLGVLQRMGGGGFAEVKMLLAAAEAFHAAGNVERAHGQLEETLRQIRVRADKIPNPEYRAKYLNNVSENVHARSLAREWLGSELLT